MTEKQLQRKVKQAVARRNHARAEADERFSLELLELYDSGVTLQSIADVLNVSRQRVHQLLRGA
jgi:DNA-directed RNA polymerase sigma subunit (sigma70/sigma32)